MSVSSNEISTAAAQHEEQQRNQQSRTAMPRSSNEIATAATQHAGAAAHAAGAAAKRPAGRNSGQQQTQQQRNQQGSNNSSEYSKSEAAGTASSSACSRNNSNATNRCSSSSAPAATASPAGTPWHREQHPAPEDTPALQSALIRPARRRPSALIQHRNPQAKGSPSSASLLLHLFLLTAFTLPAAPAAQRSAPGSPSPPPIRQPWSAARSRSRPSRTVGSSAAAAESAPPAA